MTATVLVKYWMLQNYEVCDLTHIFCNEPAQYRLEDNIEQCTSITEYRPGISSSSVLDSVIEMSCRACPVSR